jgi:ribosomal protein L37AE/L43A
MSFFDVLKWFLEAAGISKKGIVVFLVFVLLLNIGLYWSYGLANALIAYPLLIKILAHLFLSILIITSFGSISFLLSKPMLKVKMGVYWDNQQNPYCPKCKLPLTGADRGSNILKCINCKEEINLRIGAVFYSLDEAMIKIKNKEV